MLAGLKGQTDLGVKLPPRQRSDIPSPVSGSPSLALKVPGAAFQHTIYTLLIKHDTGRHACPSIYLSQDEERGEKCLFH